MDNCSEAERVFSDWALDDRAERMWRNHLPRVEQIWPRIPVSSGNYLEVGCGAGRCLRHIAENQFRAGRCTGIDVSEAMVELARKNNAGVHNVSVEKADFLSWKPPDGTHFDAIFSMEVFYYFTSIEAGISRAAAMLGPGGRLFVLVDLYKENRDSHDWSEKLGIPMQMWSKSQYIEGFNSAGLTDINQVLLHDPNGDPQVDAPTLCTYGAKKDAVLQT